MISYICGKVILKNNLEGSASIVTNGVGYNVIVGVRYLESLQLGKDVSLFIETIVKEESITLYGFLSYEKKVWFCSLLKVSGVGVKVAITVVDTLAIADIINAIASKQAMLFQSISGLGEKVSQRIVADLQKEPAKNLKYIASASFLNTQNTQIRTNVDQETGEVLPDVQNLNTQNPQSVVNVNDVTSVLCNLGYDFNSSFTIASGVCKTATTIEDAIKQALREISS